MISSHFHKSTKAFFGLAISGILSVNDDYISSPTYSK